MSIFGIGREPIPTEIPPETSENKEQKVGFAQMKVTQESLAQSHPVPEGVYIPHVSLYACSPFLFDGFRANQPPHTINVIVSPQTAESFKTSEVAELSVKRMAGDEAALIEVGADVAQPQEEEVIDDQNLQ
ncbi:MAG: hypothetical protein UT15_C0002G0061 [Berkelbacteria bacterium GW2011_GWA1_39_10]|uniref:Uncharacterized protein n=1 Tax=Berkelbacteria bacterium GW2011_GWA1_39_10 TaxID=1618332 RepID=A0A0G0LGH3_9BACT|nr:MAG: hypothetical protein UT15_C0002G0061 [Berkelbacteria bacterium GW2011_GWA1_39_10]